MQHEQGRDTGPPSELCIAGWQIQPSNLRIIKNGKEVRLEPKVMSVLICLANRPGQTLTRSELEEAVWPDVIVGYDALAGSISKLRNAFDDHTKPQQIIETIPKIGYRLIAPLEPRAETRRKRPTLIIALGAVIAAVTLVLTAWLLPFGSTAPPGKPSIAVLAFDNLTGDAAQDIWSDGISENIITELSRFKDFFVIARNSSFSFKGQPVDVREIGDKLGARYVLEGSFRRPGDTVRITAQLIDATTGNHLWAESYTRDSDRLHEVLDEITRTLVATLGGRLDSIEIERIAANEMQSPEAYELYQRGRQIWFQWTREANDRAAKLYEQAIAVDPNYAGAYRSLAWVYINEHRYDWGESRDKSLVRAFQAGETALVLAPNDHRVHWTLATVHMRAGSHERALAAYEHALVLNPNAADVFADLSVVLTYQGRFDEAISSLEQAMLLNPLYPYWYAWNLSWTYYMAERFEDAVTTFGKMNYVPARARLTLAAAYVHTGEIDKAKAEVGKFLESEPDHTLRDEKEVVAPFQDAALRQRWLDDLRVAGMPE